MALRTWAFAISFIRSNIPAAQALICPDAKYIGVRWQDGRLDRRQLTAALWRELEHELSRLTTDPLSRSSLISNVLVGSMGALLLVSFVEIQAVEIGRMEDAEQVLEDATRFGQPV